MRRSLATTLLVASALQLTDTTTSGQAERAAGGLVAVESTNLGELRAWDARVTTAARAGALRLQSARRDPALPARVVERYDQFHQGVPIWGADVVRDSQDGVPVSIFGVLSPDLELSTTPGLSIERARSALAGLLPADTEFLRPPSLVVLRLANGQHRLAYTAVLSGAADVIRGFVDADTGVELMRYSELQHQQAAVGTGTGVLGDQKKLSVQAEAAAYIAFDRHRPPVIQTFDMRGNLARTKQLEAGALPYSSSDLATDTDNVWTDPAVVDAHAHVSWTYDYYFKRFGRNGLDNRNAPINIVVNGLTQNGALAVNGTSDFGRYVTQASWCGVCGPGRQGRIFFGNGFPGGLVLSNGQNWTYTSGALDVAAHELTHAVTEASSGLVYANESGALNEAFSDMMAKGVEFFYRPAGSNVGQADYVVGKDVIRGLRPGALNGLRSMANPALFGDPDHYSHRYVGPEDGGGVHINSGIANHAFYLAIEGGTNRTSGRSVQGVGGANREQIERVFYRAFTLLMPRHSTFLIARAATVQSARDLYGAGSAAERAVTQAWDAVGVLDPAAVSNLAGSVAPGNAVTFQVSIQANGRYEAVLSWASPESVDLDLYLTPVNCSFVQPSCVLVESISGSALESIGWPVRSGERYWLTVHNYAGVPTPFTIQHWISSATGLGSVQPLASADGPSITAAAAGVVK